MTNRPPMPVDHPGSFIAEELDARGWLQADLAYILGMDAGQLNKIITGKADLNPDIAVSFGDAFDMPPEFFMNLQKLYDLNRAKKADPGVRTRASWLSKFPVREMIKRKWIEDTEPALLDLQMMRFFEKNRVSDIPFVGEAPVAAYAARKSSDYDTTTEVQYVWLTRVRKIAEQMDVPAYSEKMLRAGLKDIRAHMMLREDFGGIPHLLGKCGVRFVLVEALPGSKIDGVCLWIGEQPVIGMTLRMDRADNFCFVLRHEIEHVLNQDGKEVSFAPVDEFDTERSGATSECERLADFAAAEFCVPQNLLESFILRKSPFISERDVAALAARVEINIAVVIGQIQKKTQRYTFLRKYQTSIRDCFSDWKYTDGWGHFVTNRFVRLIMSDYNEQVNQLWDTWIHETGQVSGDPGEFVDWATTRRLLAVEFQDLKQLLRKRVTQALRQAKRFDVSGGFHYRAKQSVTLFDVAGIPIKHYFDTDRGGSPTLRQRAMRQRREAIAHDVYRAVCDADHMNKVFPEDPQLNFFEDFTDDVAEKRIADQLSAERDSDDDDDDAAA